MWRINITVPVYCRYSVQLFYLLLACLIIIAPWPKYLSLMIGPLMILLYFQYSNCYEALNRMNGEFTLDSSSIFWQKQCWTIKHSPFILPYFMVVDLISQQEKKSHRLLIFTAGMSRRDWRKLCYLLLQLAKNNRK